MSMCFRPSRPCSGLSGCTEASTIAGTCFAQPSADADERAAGAEAGDEVRHSPFRLPDDLGPGRVVMRPPVELVVVLVRVEVARRVGGVPPPRLANRAVGAFERIGEERAPRHRPSRSASAPASRSPARTASPGSQAPRRSSRRQCRCCPKSRPERLSRPELPAGEPLGIIRRAGRSLTEPPGFLHSAFPYSSTPGKSRSIRLRRMSGVSPTRSNNGPRRWASAGARGNMGGDMGESLGKHVLGPGAS